MNETYQMHSIATSTKHVTSMFMRNIGETFVIDLQNHIAKSAIIEDDENRRNNLRTMLL